MKNEDNKYLDSSSLDEQLTEEERAMLFSDEDIVFESRKKEKVKEGKIKNRKKEQTSEESAKNREKEQAKEESAKNRDEEQTREEGAENRDEEQTKEKKKNELENQEENEYIKNGRRPGRFQRQIRAENDKFKSADKKVGKSGKISTRKAKKMSSKKKKWLIVGGIVALLIVSTVVRSAVKSMMPASIEVSTAKIGEIQKSLDTSGTFKSMKQKIYFSPVSATVAKCYVDVGDVVKEGAKLVDFDLSELQTKQTEANLQKDSNYYSYSDALEKSKKAEQDLTNAEDEITRLKNQISTQKNNINNIQNYIAELNRNQGLQVGSSETSTSTSRTQTSSNVESMLSSAQRDLERAQSDLADLQSDLSKAESEREQAKSSILTEDEKKKLEVEKYSAEISAQVAGETATKGSTGITSEFEGIVTDVKAPTGSMATQGGELMTIESNQEIILEVELSKYDLEIMEEGENAKITLGDYTYDGIVSKISRAVVKNEQGKSSIIAEIKVLNPDDNIYLGIEGKVTIEGKKYTNILVIPTESINVSKDDSFCYVIKDSKVERRDIETGATNGQKTQVVEGLKQGEQVVLNPETVVEDGKRVIAVEKNIEEAE